jgi:hypothetical protein
MNTPRYLILKAHVETGDQQATSSLYMHTVDTFLDTEDVAILDGDGCLVLSLQKETYESFGLEGRAAKFAGKGQRYSRFTSSFHI